jgi:L-ornithine N5-oxygenase
VDGIFAQDPSERAAAIAMDRGTNYGVVCLSLLEHLYENMYIQRLQTPDETNWRCRIVPNRTVLSASQSSNSSVILHLGESGQNGHVEEDLEVDHIFVATGYIRNAHEDMLSQVSGLLPEGERMLNVGRDYRVAFDDSKVIGAREFGCRDVMKGLMV